MGPCALAPRTSCTRIARSLCARCARDVRELCARCAGVARELRLGALVPWCLVLGVVVPWRPGSLVTWLLRALAHTPSCLGALACPGALVPWRHCA